MRAVRRLGVPPPMLGTSVDNGTCPDILELADGRFAVIGTDITHEVKDLPAGAACASYERIVAIPRVTLISAKEDIPDH